MGTRPLWTDNSQIWHEGSCVGHSHWKRILPKSVKRFRNCGGLKMVDSHWLEASPLQQVSTTVLPVITQTISYWTWFYLVKLSNLDITNYQAVDILSDNANIPCPYVVLYRLTDLEWYYCMNSRYLSVYRQEVILWLSPCSQLVQVATS